MYIDFNHFLLLQQEMYMTHKSKITPATSPLFCNPYLAKHTLLLISMLPFRMCNILKFNQKQFSSTYSILAYLFTAMLCDHTINVILCLWVMFSVLIVLIVLRGLIWAE